MHAFGAPRDEPLTSSYADLAELAGANARAAHARRRPGDRRRLRRHRPGALAHLVRQLRRSPRLAAARRAARRHRALARAAAAVEGRAARRRLRRLVVGRADVVRGRGRRDRGVGGDARRRAARPTPRSTRTGCTSSTTASTPTTVVARRRPRTGCASWASTRTGPSVVFVGRITRQKGLPLFLRAVAQLPPGGAGRAVRGRAGHPRDRGRGRSGLVDGLRESRDGVVWIREMLPRADVVALLTAATVFACPSIYEPLGIVNLEAMACETAVVATATGGIPEVVVPALGLGTTGDRPAGADRAGHRRHRHAARPRPATSPTSPPRSPRSSPTPTGPPRWAGPAGSGRSTPSAGPRSPSGPSRSTARCSDRALRVRSSVVSSDLGHASSHRRAGGCAGRGRRRAAPPAPAGRSPPAGAGEAPRRAGPAPRRRWPPGSPSRRARVRRPRGPRGASTSRSRNRSHDRRVGARPSARPRGSSRRSQGSQGDRRPGCPGQTRRGRRTDAGEPGHQLDLARVEGRPDGHDLRLVVGMEHGDLPGGWSDTDDPARELRRLPDRGARPCGPSRWRPRTCGRQPATFQRLVKLMYAAWGDDLPRPAARRRACTQRLAGAGVRRLQLNLDDEDVAPAMRIATGPDHIGAIDQRVGRHRRRGHRRPGRAGDPRWPAGRSTSGCPIPPPETRARRADGRARQRRRAPAARRPRPRGVAAPLAGRPHADRDRRPRRRSATSRTS